MKCLSIIKNIKNQAGLSLIELVLTLVLLGMILAIGYNFFFLGYTSFVRGEAQSIIQSYTRNTAAIITKDLRNATKIGVFNDLTDAAVQANERVFYLENNRVYHQQGTSQILYETEPFISDINFELEVANDKYVLVFIIEGNKDGKIYIIESNVLLNNISYEKIFGESDITGKVLKYKK
ncbi:MAG: prepilin-type N-terminal cleavage/methylation domain-containing protein [Clostridia bacterium]|nr:prepilin-type N-terminal cleavage/methylation domain-containing protein [Clostridia bacterium]